MNEYIKELKILRTEITVIKNLINSSRTLNSRQFNVEYEYEVELDEDGNPKLDEKGNVILKLDKDGKPILKLDENGYPIVKDTSGKFTNFIVDKFKSHFNFTYALDDKGEILYDVEGYPIIGSTVLDEDGNIKLDKNGKPVTTQDYLGSIVKFIIKEFIDYHKVEKLKNEKGELVLDKEGKDSINEKTLGRIPNYVLRKFLEYLKIDISKDKTGKITVNEEDLGKIPQYVLHKIIEYFKVDYTTQDGKEVINQAVSGFVINFIVKELTRRLEVPDGEIPKYIHKSFEDRFGIKEQGSKTDGIITILLKNNHTEVIDKIEETLETLETKLDNMYENISNDFTVVMLDLERIKSAINSVSSKVDTANTNASNASANALAAYSNTQSILSKLDSLTTTINTINDNTKPSS